MIKNSSGSLKKYRLHSNTKVEGVSRKLCKFF